MPIGFILIATKCAKEKTVFDELLKLPEIIEIHPLFGEYDMIAKVEVEDFNALGKIVTDKIRTVNGVTDARTLTGLIKGRGI